MPCVRNSFIVSIFRACAIFSSERVEASFAFDARIVTCEETLLISIINECITKNYLGTLAKLSKSQNKYMSTYCNNMCINNKYL